MHNILLQQIQNTLLFIALVVAVVVVVALNYMVSKVMTTELLVEQVEEDIVLVLTL